MSFRYFDNTSLNNNYYRASRAFSSKDYSLVLNYLYPLYNHFYNYKRNIYKSLPSKKASTSKEEYFQWRELYYQHSYQNNYSQMLATILKYSEDNKVLYQNVEGGDILRRTFAMKRYCDMFYKLK